MKSLTLTVWSCNDSLSVKTVRRDYAGTSFPTVACDADFRWSRLRVDWETGTYDEAEPCDASTGDMNTEGWHVDSLNQIDILNCPCEEGEPVKSNLRWFFSQLFHTPSLQSEFWALWDIVVEHRLVESTSASGDLFSLDLLIDYLFEPQKQTAIGMC